MTENENDKQDKYINLIERITQLIEQNSGKANDIEEIEITKMTWGEWLRYFRTGRTHVAYADIAMAVFAALTIVFPQYAMWFGIIILALTIGVFVDLTAHLYYH